MSKVITLGIIVLIFAVAYTTLVFNSDFGVPEVSAYDYGYPCENGFVQADNLFGYQFENCYTLKLNFWNNKNG